VFAVAVVTEIRGGEDASADRTEREADPDSPTARAIAGLARHLADSEPVDERRIYLVAEGPGADLGWLVLAAEPGVFAAAVLIAGDGDPDLAPRVSQTPLWMFHGERDDRVPVGRARSMVSAIWAAEGADIRYSEFRGVGFAAWVSAWEELRLLPWLFSHGRE
jgi:predicted peptidase